MAGSHEGRKANPALDLKLIDCGERSRCEPVSSCGAVVSSSCLQRVATSLCDCGLFL